MSSPDIMHCFVEPMPEAPDPLASSQESVHSTSSDRYLWRVERFWRRRQPWLESQGYMLRPRFCPSWVPSWITGDVKMQDAEDSLVLSSVMAIDATRIWDGKPVFVKFILTGEVGTSEVDISLFFSEEPRRSDPRNHCVPVLDVLHHPDEQRAYVVTPALRKFDSPPFLTVGEAVDFINQIFEGLLFMHENFVVHRDCAPRNVMMDASQMYPQSFHPTNITMSRDLQGPACHLTRTECKPKYYFIDFGLALHYDPQRDAWPPLEEALRGVDAAPPEYEVMDRLHDPFLADVWYLGNLIRERFLQRFKGLSFLDQLVSRMVQDDPDLRPPMHEVINAFSDIHRNLSYFTLRSRLAKRNEFVVAKYWRTGIHIMKMLRYKVAGVPPLSFDSNRLPKMSVPSRSPAST